MDILRISNTQRKFLQGLKLKKNRLKYGQFVAEGPKVVSEIVQYKYIIVKELYALSSWIEEHEASNIFQEYPVHRVTSKELERISSLKSPDRVLAKCLIPSDQMGQDAQKILYLDQIKNPGNLGTILRTCDWYGLDQVVLSADSVDPFNPKVVQAAMGSLGRIPMARLTLKAALKQWSSLPVYHSTLDGESVDELDIDPSRWILTIGSESHGLSKDALSIAGTKVKLWKQSKSPVDSLNAAVAAAILISKFS